MNEIDRKNDIKPNWFHVIFYSVTSKKYTDKGF